MIFTDRAVDMVADRIDVAIRIGRLLDSTLLAQRLGTVGHRLCASPEWLEGNGLVGPDSLEGLPIVVDTNQPVTWSLTGPDEAKLQVRAEGRYVVNNTHAALDACRAGLGLALLPDFVGAAALAKGELVEALPGWKGHDLGLYVITQERRSAAPSVRALVEHVRGLLVPLG